MALTAGATTFVEAPTGPDVTGARPTGAPPDGEVVGVAGTGRLGQQVDPEQQHDPAQHHPLAVGGGPAGEPEHA